MNERKLILYIATSLDGFIVNVEGDLSWLSIVERPGEDYGYNEFIATIDTVIMGHRTYEKVLTFEGEFPHKSRKCYVITRSRIKDTDHVEFYRGDLTKLIKDIRSREGKHIFLDGGAKLVHEFMKSDLIDEYIISTIPLYLGSGLTLYPGGTPELKMDLVKSRSYPSGLVQSHYVRLR
jgi:dihydrofolate reductase